MIYSGRGFKDWEIGDIEVIIHEGLFHLFHLIIPNHDYIAHAVSEDGINWKRVKNALFVGHPGEWDDDMLWTMDVSEEGDGFVMYYTGLALADEGQKQKIGRAYSKDLYDWTKDDDVNPILESGSPHYEDADNNPRGWLSWRDPFRYQEEGKEYLLICGRTGEGQVHHRGCVAIAEKTGNATFELMPPLLYPRLYDDVECPCLIKLKDRYYLIGSIREDIKVRYWHAEYLTGPYQSFHSDLLLPGGNYAARVIDHNGRYLVYNFYFSNKDISHKRVLPPPKELDVDDDGRLYLKSHNGWNNKVTSHRKGISSKNINVSLHNPTASCKDIENGIDVASVSGYEIFNIERPAANFAWKGNIALKGLGKCGFVLNEDGKGNGYYISLDFLNGYTRIRAWGPNYSDMTQDFIFTKLQSNLFKTNDDLTHEFKLIYYGNYIEFSIDNKVQLSLVDDIFSEGGIGVYVASAQAIVTDCELFNLDEVKENYTDVLMDPGVPSPLTNLA